MKSFTIIISFVLLSFSGNAQSLGSLKTKTLKPREGIETIINYYPPSHLSIPVNIYAAIVYKIDEHYYFERIQMLKSDEFYKCSFLPPKSIHAFTVVVTDENRKTIDDNNEIGYTINLFNSQNQISSSSYFEAADLLSYYAPKIFKLNWKKLRPEMIKLYEKGYALDPASKKESVYTFYLSLLYQERNDEVKDFLLTYAKQMASEKVEENSWVNALSTYKILKMDKEYDKVENIALQKYPNGKVAQDKYIDSFWDHENKTEEYIISAMTNYVDRFKDTSEQMKYTFSLHMIGLLIKERKWDKLPRYDSLMSNKLVVSEDYNYYARKLCGTKLNDPGNDLEIAEMLSRKSIKYAREILSKNSPDKSDGVAQISLNKYLDTYALIMFKQGKYDSAFYFQNLVYKTNREPDAEFFERYIMYAEKSKGEQYAYKILTDQLSTGISSGEMFNMLKTYSDKMGIPEAEYNLIKTHSDSVASERNRQLISKKLGFSKAKDFKLINLQGDTVSLSSFKNKIIILDFWASWCGPCISSFPSMQKAVDYYKTDYEIVFLFINSWERTSSLKMKETAKHLIAENKYSFNVLFDEKNKIAEDYQVLSIPATFIINRNGDIVFMGESSNILLEIEHAKKLYTRSATRKIKL